MELTTWSASAKLAARVLLLGFGKLLTIKKKCHYRFVVMCVCFTTNCQNEVTIKVASARHSPVAFLHATTHTVALAGTCTSLVLFTMKLTSRHARSCGRTQSGVIQHLAQTRASKMTSKFPLLSNLHSLLNLNVKFNVLFVLQKDLENGDEE